MRRVVKEIMVVKKDLYVLPNNRLELTAPSSVTLFE